MGLFGSLFGGSGLTKDYVLGKHLGSGNFAEVKEATRKADGTKVAVKIIDKAKVGDMADALQSEIDIMRAITHPNIIKLFSVYDEKKKMNLVMELVTGGELFDRIVDRGSYTEKDAASLICELCQALAYLHAKGIVHRDLKPENLLYASTADDAPIKLADFGLSKLCGDTIVLQTACGTPNYVAPEILANKGYGIPVDMWSVGVILYILLCGFPPFYEEELPALFQQIMSGKKEFPSPWWDGISRDAKDLVNKLLVVDPKKRFTAAEVLKHKWVQGNAPTRRSSTFGGSSKRRRWA
jgi:serine/threonine protein kinase